MKTIESACERCGNYNQVSAYHFNVHGYSVCFPCVGAFMVGYGCFTKRLNEIIKNL